MTHSIISLIIVSSLHGQPLEENQFILFSSSLNRYITANDNKDFLVNLSCHYQLI